MSRRILHLLDDPRAVAALDEWRVQHQWPHAPSSSEDPLRGALESLAARGVVPDDWTHDARVEALRVDWRVPSLVLRNPGALIAAERLLLDELARCAQEHGSPVGRYVGVRSWESLCAKDYAYESGKYLPSSDDPGFRSCDTTYKARTWVNTTRGTGDSYGTRGRANVWCMADQLATGALWLVSLYETGFGLWCWREAWEDCEWVLIVRPGDGLPWPEYEESES